MLDGYGNPFKPTGMVFSAFRPSDDCTVYGFLVPSNLFAVTSLRQGALIMEKANQKELALSARLLADEIYEGV